MGEKKGFNGIDTHKSCDRVVVAAVWLILAHSFGINSVSDYCGYIENNVLTIVPDVWCIFSILSCE